MGPSDFVLSHLKKAVKLNKNAINTIRTISVHNPYGADWHYRYLTTQIVITNNDGSITPAYVQVFSNVDQIQDAMSRAMLVILTTMVAFWLLSVVISLYLANWTLKPILSAYEKQKEFVENASHELRTPLAILQNRLELLFQKPTATIIDESENISESLSEVRNMRLLTTNLLNLARRESGIKIEPEATTAAFFEMIFNSYEMLAENAGKLFTGTVKLEGAINLDQALIKQLLTILFDNALKYTDDDGEISLDVQKNGGNLIFTVADNGEGISNDDKKKIFDRFFRVDKARTRQKGGLGLGLSLAKQIVDAYNGKISVEDNQPQGTKFIIRIRLDNSMVNPAKIFQKL
jgi:two-component system sensor histidine kinase CiaH